MSNITEDRMSPAPAFSFVATSRNDDHGGDVLRRTQSFITNLAKQCVRHEVACELVLVEWNPPEGRAPLTEVLEWSAGSEWFSARVITVSRALHGELKFSKRLQMFQMIAKNVGIRRARGEHVIATNIDIIFSDELFRWLKSGAAKKGVLYRSDRWDIPNAVQAESDLDVLLQRARTEAIRRNLMEGTYVRTDAGFVNISGNRIDQSVISPIEALLSEVKSTAANDAIARCEVMRSIDTILGVHLPLLRREYLAPPIHTNGCGDFTMMSRADWFALRGYPEWNVFSWHIDSILIFQAHYNGIPVEVLDPSCVHYHIEHDYGSGWTPEGATDLWSRLSQQGIPFITHRQFFDILISLQKSEAVGEFSLFNDENWGFSNHQISDLRWVDIGTASRRPTAVNSGRPQEEFLAELVHAGVEFDLGDARPVEAGVQVAWRTGADGVRELSVETLALRWSYALTVDLTSHRSGAGEYWIKVELIVENGDVGVGILNLEEREFWNEVTCRAADRQIREVYAHIPALDKVSQLVLRNVTPGGTAASFRLRSMTLLRERESDRERARSAWNIDYRPRKLGDVTPPSMFHLQGTSVQPQNNDGEEHMSVPDNKAGAVAIVGEAAVVDGPPTVAASSLDIDPSTIFGSHAGGEGSANATTAGARKALASVPLRSYGAFRRRPARNASSRFDGSAVYLGSHTALARLHTGQKIYVDTRDASIASHLMLDGRWEARVEEALEELVAPGMTIVDVGASFGYFTLVMARRMQGKGRLIAMEPNPDVARLLELSVIVNGLQSTVEVSRMAAYYKSASLNFRFCRETVGSGTILETDTGSAWNIESRQVLGVALDDVVTPETVVNVVKISAEGAEPFIFAGMKRILQQSPSPALVFDLHARRLANSRTPETLLETLSHSGYALYVVGTKKRPMNPRQIMAQLGDGFACIVAKNR